MVMVVNWSGREARALREARRMSLRAFAAHLGLARGSVVNWEHRGELARLRHETQEILDRDLSLADDSTRERFEAALAGPSFAAAPSAVCDHVSLILGVGDGLSAGGDGQRQDRSQVEVLRQQLHDALSEGIAEASLDDWENAVLRRGRATRDQSAGTILADLTTDLAEVRRALHRHHSASALRRLSRVAAQMSGLMCLTLCKLDDRPAFRSWARTARLAGHEAGDPETYSWVLAHEAYGHYYGGDLREAVKVAQHARQVVTTPCVGAALAAALEARAHAAMGSAKQTRTTLGRAEDILSHLDGDALAPSAFGYNEAQLRFHESSAYTRLGDARAALAAQDRALELCAPGDYTDWAMIRLDRASCLIAAGDPAGALAYAAETLTRLTEPQRWGIITLRGNEVLAALPGDQRTTPAARDLRELLMLTTEQKGLRHP